MKECCRPQRGSNLRPPGLQSDGHPTEPSRPTGRGGIGSAELDHSLIWIYTVCQEGILGSVGPRLTTFYFKAPTPTTVKVWLIIYNKVPDVLTHVTDEYIDSSVSKKHLVCCVKYKLATKIPNRNFCIVLRVVSVFSICYHFLKKRKILTLDMLKNSNQKRWQIPRLHRKRLSFFNVGHQRCNFIKGYTCLTPQLWIRHRTLKP